MADPIIVITNTPTKQEALQIASAAVERHLAAAVNILGPMTSVYRWQGKVESTEEWQCFLKTNRERYEEIEQIIHAFHSYELPGILALPVTTGNADYLNWIEKETRVIEASDPVGQDEIRSKTQLMQDLAEAHERLIEAASIAHQRGVMRNGDEWGPREILAHIAGWEAVAAERIPKIVAGLPPISYVSEEQHTASDDTINATMIAMIGDQSFDDVCRILREAYQRDIQMLSKLDDSLFLPENYVYWRAKAAIEHCYEHRQALEKLN